MAAGSAPWRQSVGMISGCRPELDRHLSPQRREPAGLAHQDLVAGRQRVDERGFPRTRARRGINDDGIARLEDRLELGEHLASQDAELRAAMIHRRLRHRAQHAVRHVGRTRNLEKMSAARVAHRDIPTRFATRVYLAERTSAGDNGWPRRELQPKPPLDASINAEKPVDRWRTGRARGGARVFLCTGPQRPPSEANLGSFGMGSPQLSACCDARGGALRSPCRTRTIARSTRRRHALQTAAMQHRISAGAIVEDAAGQILLVRHVLPGKYDFWVAPGGGVQGREELAAAAIREVREETGLHVAVDRLAYIEEFANPDTRHVKFWFTARLVGGSLSAEAPEAKAEHIVEAAWLSRADFGARTVFPLVLADRYWDDRAAGFTTTAYLGLRTMEFW